MHESALRSLMGACAKTNVNEGRIVCHESLTGAHQDSDISASEVDSPDISEPDDGTVCLDSEAMLVDSESVDVPMVSGTSDLMLGPLSDPSSDMSTDPAPDSPVYPVRIFGYTDALGPTRSPGAPLKVWDVIDNPNPAP